MSIVFITGGTSGIGAEAAMQLSKLHTISKIIITSRSESSAKKAITALVAKSGVRKSKFDFVTMDLNDVSTCVAAVESLPTRVDVSILNAGSISLQACETLTSTGVTQAFQSTCIGHGVVLETLLASGKVPEGGRIIYAAGELQRSVWLFTGFQPFPTWNIEDTEKYPAKPPSSFTNVRALIAGMQHYKTFMTLFISKLARENPSIYIASVSPGGTATGFYDMFSQPLKFLVQSAPTRGLFHLLGGLHSVETAAGRYVDAATSKDFPDFFPTGALIMSPKGVATGPLTNNTGFRKEFGDEVCQDRVAKCLRKEIKKCGNENV